MLYNKYDCKNYFYSSWNGLSTSCRQLLGRKLKRQIISGKKKTDRQKQITNVAPLCKKGRKDTYDFLLEIS